MICRNRSYSIMVRTDPTPILLWFTAMVHAWSIKWTKICGTNFVPHIFSPHMHKIYMFWSCAQSQDKKWKIYRIFCSKFNWGFTPNTKTAPAWKFTVKNKHKYSCQYLWKFIFYQLGLWTPCLSVLYNTNTIKCHQKVNPAKWLNVDFNGTREITRQIEDNLVTTCRHVRPSKKKLLRHTIRLMFSVCFYRNF